MKISIGLAVLLFALLMGGFLLHGRSAPTAAYSSAAPIATTSQTAAASTGITAADVAAHANAASCWSSINGSVYDLTKWISQHPGGAQRILSICGKDGSAAFDGQHGGDPRALSILATFKIGALAS